MNRGMGTPAIIAIIAILAALGGTLYFNMKPEGEIMMNKGEDMMHDGEAMMDDGEAMMKDGEKMMEEGEKMMKEDGAMMEEGDHMMEGDSMMEEGAMMHDGYKGEVLAGSSDKAVLLDFNQADYEKAVAEGKTVALYFYANWCPTCKLEFPKMQEAFNQIDSNNVVGFRVNYNDSQTDDFEKSLAKEFGVAYQHTKVFVKNGERVLKSPESWTTSQYISNINGAIN